VRASSKLPPVGLPALAREFCVSAVFAEDEPLPGLDDVAVPVLVEPVEPAPLPADPEEPD
jgi:hypothetical protein